MEWSGHYTALHSTPLHCNALHCTALHCTALHGTTLWEKKDGEYITQKVNQCYNKVVHWRRNLVKEPFGKAGTSFVHEISRMFQAYSGSSALERIAMKATMIMPALLLQKPHLKSRTKEHAKHLERRLATWKVGDLDSVLDEGQTIQSRLARDSNCQNTTPHHTTPHHTTPHHTTPHHTTPYHTPLHSFYIFVLNPQLIPINPHHSISFYSFYSPLHTSITLHSTPLHCTALLYTTPHYTTLNYTTLHNTTLHQTTPHHTTPHHTTPHYTTPHHITPPPHYTPLHFTPLLSTPLHSTPLILHHSSVVKWSGADTTLHCTAQHSTPLQCTALHCTALHCTTLHYTLGRKGWRIYHSEGQSVLQQSSPLETQFGQGTLWKGGDIIRS